MFSKQPQKTHEGEQPPHDSLHVEQGGRGHFNTWWFMVVPYVCVCVRFVWLMFLQHLEDRIEVNQIEKDDRMVMRGDIQPTECERS